jgi:hypothetical protein
MKALPKLPKNLRSYFIDSAIRGVGIWLGLSLIGAVLIYYFMGFLGLSDIKRNVGFLGFVLAGIVHAAAYLIQVYRHACRVAKDIEAKHEERVS